MGNVKKTAPVAIMIACGLVFLVTSQSPEITYDLAYKNTEKLNLISYLTSMFTHGGFIHLLFNMVTLYGFGLVMERFLGKKEYFGLYFFSGFLGTFVWMLCNFNSDGVVVGASGAVCGVIAAFAMLYPKHKVLLFFIIPIEVKKLMYILIPLSIGLWLLQIGPPIAHMAHMGGILGGYLYMKWHRKRTIGSRKRPTDDEKFFMGIDQ